MKKNLSNLILIILIVTMASVGAFYNEILLTGSATNIYGDVIEFFGRGIYARESAFKGPIHVGTDIAMLFIMLSFVGLLIFGKKHAYKETIQLGYYTIFTYYTASVAFSTMMNELFLLYIAAFSVSLFHLISSIASINYKSITTKIQSIRISRMHLFFLLLSGLSVSVWLFEILEVILHGQPRDIIGMLSTEPTYVIDLAIVLPVCLASIVLLRKRNGIGAVLSLMMTSLLSSIGLIVVSQSITQIVFGIQISIFEWIMYVVVFVLLSLFSVYFAKKSVQLIHGTYHSARSIKE